MTFVQFQVREKYKRHDKVEPLNPLPGGGDFQEVFLQAVHGLSAQGAIKNTEKKTYIRVREPQVSNRGVLVSIQTGHYNEPADIIDTETGKVVVKVRDQDSHSIDLRCLLLTPEAGKAAVLAVEHGQRRSAATQILDAVRAVWKSVKERDEAYTLRMESVVEEAGWVAAADLEAVKVVAYHHESRPEAKGVPHKLGQMTYQLEPSDGQPYLPRALKDLLLAGDVDKMALLGIPEIDSDEVSEVQVRLKHGERSKSFLVSKQSTPTIRLLLTRTDQPALLNTAFAERALTEARDYLAILGVTWQDGWKPQFSND